MQIRPGIELGNRSDVGCRRAANEDYYAYAEPENEDAFTAKGRLVVVADGLGGHSSGEIASATAVETIRDAYLRHPSSDPCEALAEAFRQAQTAILEAAAANPELEGMGTTCTCAVVRGYELSFAHVGDSRLYLIRGGSITQLTGDHSYVAQLVRDGQITPEQAESHPERNVLTAALGMRSAVPVELTEHPIALAAGDILLLCTDGLHGLVRDPEMLQVAQNGAPGDACLALVELAKQRGGFDNITVQILRIS